MSSNRAWRAIARRTRCSLEVWLGRRWTAIAVSLLMILAAGAAAADSIWAIDWSACLRVNCYPVSGGASVRSISISASECVRGVASGEGYLWALGAPNCRSVLRIDPATGNTAATIALNTDQCGVSIASGDGFLWVLLGNSQIAKVDPSLGQIIASVAPAFGYPPVCIAYGGGCLWAVENLMQIRKIDPSTGAILQTLDPSGTDRIAGLTYGNGFLWAAGLNGGAKVSKIDPSNGSVVSTATYGIGWNITALAYEGGASGPATPTVTDDGAYTTRSDRLHASWSGGTGIVEYQYAIGRSPTDLITGWTSVGAAADIIRTGLSLQVGTAYYWYVKARDAAGQWSAIGASDGIVVGTPVTVSAAKSTQIGGKVILSSVIVTAQLSDCLYVESEDRSSGIKITGALQLSVGGRADIAGSVEVSSGEKAVRVTTCTVTGTGTIDPIGTSVGSLAVYGPNAGVVQSLGSSGLCSVGLLVRTWGEVTARGTGWFYVDDGSHPKDGTGSEGLRVLCEGITPPAQGKHVRVTGISTLFSQGASWLPALRLRTPSDLRLLD